MKSHTVYKTLPGPHLHRPSHATVVAYLALFVALGGSSYAALQITSRNVPKDALTGADIKRLTGKDINDNSVTGKDVKSIKSADVADHSLLARDFKSGQLPGTLGGVRAYAAVEGGGCPGTPGPCQFGAAKGVSAVTRTAVGTYCVVAPGVDGTITPAAVSVEQGLTTAPEGNASAMLTGAGCAPGFQVVTQRQPNVNVNSGGGTNNATVAAPAEPANDVAFTIVIP